MATNPYGPKENLPFADALVPGAPQQSQSQFSGFQGKLGAATGLVAKFLSGVSEGRVKAAEKIENDKAQKFAAIARLGQQIENDPTLTPEAKSQKTGAIMKIYAQQVLDQTGGDKKGKGGKDGQDGSGHPALGFIKNIATRLAGGPLPKKWDGPSTEDILKIAAHGPDDTIQGRSQQFETAIAEKAKVLPKDYTTDDLQKNGIMQIIGQAQQSGSVTPGMQSLLKTAEDNATRAGKLSEERGKLQIQQDVGGVGGERFEKSVAPPGTKDRNGQDISGKPANRVTNVKTGQLLGWDAAAPTAADKPKFTTDSATVLGSQVKGQFPKDYLGNPVSDKGEYRLVKGPDQKPVGVLPRASEGSYRLSPDTGDLERTPKYDAPPPPPGRAGGSPSATAPTPPGQSAVPNPAPPGTPATPAGTVKKDAPKAATPAAVSKEASKDPGLDVAAWDYILDQKLPGGQGGLKWKKQIMARSGQILDGLGIPASGLPAMRADLKANSGALSKLTWQATSLGQFEKTLQNNIDYARELNKDYDRTNVKFANRLISAARGEASDPKVTKFMAQMDPIATEWAKVMAGSTSSAGVSVRSKADAQKIIDTHLSAGTTDELFSLIQRDISNRQKAVDSERSGLLDKIKGITAAPAPPNAQSSGKTAAPAAGAPPPPPAQRKSLDQIFQ